MQKANVSQLGKLLLDSEFEALSARLHGFNLFRALKIEDYEIRHSNILAWLMDPNESHGGNQLFARRILSSMLLDTPGNQYPSAADIELMDLSDLDVRREWRSIDLLLHSEKNGLLVLVENKINSEEGMDQLARYQKIVKEEFPSIKTKLFVYLTLEGTPAENETLGYCAWSHRQIAAVLHSIISQRRNQFTTAVSEFIDQYIEVLRRKTMSDTDLVEMCKKIYRKHREAINTIIELAGESIFESASAECLKDKPFKILHQSKSWIWFLPDDTYCRLPESGAAWEMTPNVSVCCWILHDYGDYARLVFEISATKDPKERTRVMKKLEENGFKFSKAAQRVDATYSRFYNHKVKISDSSDAESIMAAIEKCLDESKEEFEHLATAMQQLYPDVIR